MENKENLSNKLAELLGWTHLENRHTMSLAGSWYGYPPIFTVGKKQPVPRYSEDLNEINKAEEILKNQSINFQSLYYDYVSLQCGWEARTVGEAKWQATWNSFRASAENRTKALIKTLETINEGYRS